MTINEDEINKNFKEQIYDGILKHLILISGLGVLALMYYVYSDLYIRDSIEAFYWRLLPLTIAIVLIVFHFITGERHKLFKVSVYNLLLISAVIMMYGVCIVHLHDNALAPSVTGAVLVIFIISLEIKTNRINTILAYFLPLLVFTLSLVFFFKPTNEEFTIMADIYPIILCGYIINRIQYRLRYKLFRSNYLLDLEKKKTEELYSESLIINEDLQKKADEITAHKEEIQEKNEKLQESNVTKDRFLAIIAHDLLNPFNTMMGFSHLLLESFEKGEDISEQRLYAYQMDQSITKTYGLLENLLIWARSQKDALEFNLANLNLFLLAHEISELVKDQADSKAITVTNLIDRDVELVADKDMLSTVLRNLVSNAIKFTPQNGKVTIASRIVNNEEDQKYIEISVKDSGLGISEEMQAKLFNITENVSTKGTNNETGTGLGLIICKEFIDKHKGNIRIESEMGKGSNFIFSLPKVNN